MALKYSLYFHIPFCKHRCAYCDFNTYAGLEALIPAYVDALCREIEVAGMGLRSFISTKGTKDTKKNDLCGSKNPGGFQSRSLPEALGNTVIKTIFFGGGTPSLLTPEQFGRIFQAIHASFTLSDPETSLEANPGTVTRESLQALRKIGFNRISFGVQSAHLEELRQLERIHDFNDVIESVKWARQAWFENLNLDLIFSLPGQSLERWQTTVKRAVDLNPEHLSLYALTVEHGTPFGRWAQRGLISMPDPDLAAEMYEWAGSYLEAQGYQQYEISNWARESPGVMCQMPEFACRHNLQVWRNRPYLGFGAGAHGYAAGIRYSNVLRIKTYIDRLQPSNLIPDHPSPSFLFSPAAVTHHHVTRREEMQETMMLGLRLVGEGVLEAAFRERFNMEMADVFREEIEDLVRLGLLEWCEEKDNLPPGMELAGGERLRLTRRGMLMGNRVFIKFVE